MPVKSSAADAYDRLLQAIDNGALPPGSRLRESELAKRFGISRTPVREALKRLEAQGLVTHEAHHGAVVASLNYSEITELYYLRGVLEGTAARLAAVHATDTEVEILQEMVVADRQLVGGNAGKLAHTNRKFHLQLHLSARNRFLNAVLDTMRLSLVLLAGTTLRAPNRDVESIDEHDAIVRAIAAHDPDAAEAAARTHIRNAFKARVRLNLEESVGHRS